MPYVLRPLLHVLYRTTSTPYARSLATYIQRERARARARLWMCWGVLNGMQMACITWPAL